MDIQNTLFQDFIITQVSIYFPSDEIQINCKVYHVIEDHRGRCVQMIPK